MALIPVAAALGHAVAALARVAICRLLPSACAFCASSSTTNKAAYIGTTLLLIGLPAGFLTACVAWLIRRAR